MTDSALITSPRFQPDVSQDSSQTLVHEPNPFQASSATSSHQPNLHQQHYLATHDLLTGLHNERMFKDRVNHEINYCERHQSQFAIMLLDLNNFKRINEELGVSFGDLVLRETAKCIKGCVRSTDTVARWKADQFLLLLTNINKAQEVAKIARKILAAFSHPVHLDDQEYFIHASVAICLFPQDGKSYDILFQRLCQTLPRVKQGNDITCQFYNLEITHLIHQQNHLEDELKRSMVHNDIDLRYQPIVDVRNGAVHQLKANLVWDTEVIPASVIKLLTMDFLEQTLVEGLDDWTLFNVCQQLRHWQDHGIKVHRVSLEVSAQQFLSFNLVEKLRNCLAEMTLDPRLLILEIKEQTILVNSAQALEYLKRLKHLGISLCLSNFGHGQTHLGLLKELPVDYIKLATTLIENIERSEADQAIVQGIVAIARGLDKTVIAQGVENIAQLNILSKFNCNLMQGPIIHNALSAEEVSAL